MNTSIKRISAAAIVVCAIAAVIYLAMFDPTRWPAPRCIFHALTGWECPGCGTQRAVHALFSGHFAEAWSFNPALFVAVPLAALYAWEPAGLKDILYSRITLFSLIAAIILWWILRNLL